MLLTTAKMFVWSINFKCFFPHSQNHFLLRRSPHLDTTPIRIPRVRISPSIERELGTGWAENGAEWRHSRVPPSPGSCHSSGGWPSSPSPSPHCLSAAGDTPFQNVPMKKVIRRSRMVSIHDGRPMGPFAETIHYEPSTNASYYSSADEGKRGEGQRKCRNDQTKVGNLRGKRKKTEDEDEQ